MTIQPGKMLILGATTALGSLAIQMFIPAMPIMARELGASPSAMQLTITLYLAGLGLGQLVSGPLADHLGRRPLLLGGIAIFLAGSILAMIAPAMPLLLLGRLLQSLGGAASLVTGRSIVADSTGAANASRQMASLSMITLISPMLAPGLGGTITDVAGWRAVFLILAGVSLLLGALAWRMVTESIDRSRSPACPSWQAYQGLLGNPRFLRIIIGNASYSMALYVFLAIAPFLMAGQLHMSAHASGGTLLFIAGTMIAGTLLHRRPRTAERAMSTSKALTIMGVGVMTALAVMLPVSLPAIMTPMCLIALGIGLNGPAAVAQALNLDRSRIATASSLFGAAQTLLSALAIALVAAVHATSSLGLSLLVGACVVSAAVLLPSHDGGASRSFARFKRQG